MRAAAVDSIPGPAVVLRYAVLTAINPRFGVLGWRPRRNYLWIYAAVLLTWISKLEIANGHQPI
jgi:uncharacterized membrane protein